jgi:hypothetical protein
MTLIAPRRWNFQGASDLPLADRVEGTKPIKVEHIARVQNITLASDYGESRVRNNVFSLF